MRSCQRVTSFVLAGILATVSPLAAGCSTMRPVALNTAAAPPAFSRISTGDTVEVQMRDGRHDKFQVASIDGDTLVSKAGGRYQRAEMVQLKHQRISQKRTWFLVGGIVAGLFVLLVIAVASADFPVYGSG